MADSHPHRRPRRAADADDAKPLVATACRVRLSYIPGRLTLTLLRRNEAGELAPGPWVHLFADALAQATDARALLAEFLAEAEHRANSRAVRAEGPAEVSHDAQEPAA